MSSKFSCFCVVLDSVWHGTLLALWSQPVGYILEDSNILLRQVRTPLESVVILNLYKLRLLVNVCHWVSLMAGRWCSPQGCYGSWSIPYMLVLKVSKHVYGCCWCSNFSSFFFFVFLSSSVLSYFSLFADVWLEISLTFLLGPCGEDLNHKFGVLITYEEIVLKTLELISWQ
jgi:hypothetical protein